MRKLILITFLLLVALSANVFADQITHYNSNIHTGWNLVSGVVLHVITHDVAKNSTITTENIKVIYGLTNNKYFLVYPTEEKTVTQDDLVKGAYWMYSDKDGSVSFDLRQDPLLSSAGTKLTQGWNIVGITADMRDSKVSSFIGNCNVEKYAIYEGTEWKVITSDILSQAHYASFGDVVWADSESDVTQAYLVKVTNDCALGSNVIAPPAIPN